MRIPLSNSKLEAEVDEQDYLILILLGPYHLAGKGYVRTNCSPQEYLHHLVARRMGLRDFETIDHEDRNRLNNRRSNLKAATYSENLINTSLRTTNSSGHRFVVWSSQKNKWQVEINRTEFRKHLGFFDKVEDAVKARDEFLKTFKMKTGDL